MGVDREGLLPEPAIEHDIGSLAPHAGELHQRFARIGHLTAMFIDEDLAERDHVLGLGVEQADGLDVLLQAVFTEIEHLLRRLHLGEQRAGRLVHADIGRLRAQCHSNEQLIGIAIFQLGLGRGVILGQSAEEFEDLVFGHSPALGCAAFHSIAISARFSTEGWV